MDLQGPLGRRFCTNSDTDRVRSLSPVAIFALAAALLLALSTNADVQQTPPPPQAHLEPGQRVEITVDKEIEGLRRFSGTVVRVDSLSITLTAPQVERGSINIPLVNIQSYEMMKRTTTWTRQETPFWFIYPVLAAFVGFVLYLLLRSSPEQRRKNRGKNLRDPKMMGLVGGMVGLVGGGILIVAINGILDNALEKWGVGVRGGKSAAPLWVILLVLCVWFFAWRFSVGARRRQ